MINIWYNFIGIIIKILLNKMKNYRMSRSSQKKYNQPLRLLQLYFPAPFDHPQGHGVNLRQKYHSRWTS